MIKHTSFDPYLPDGERSIIPIEFSAQVKTASVPSSAPEDVKKYLAVLTPDSGSIYYLSNALGTGEKWGANRNGDYFPEEDLAADTEEYGYKTFTSAHPFLGHRNSDPKLGYGDIPFAHMDKEMGRVYVIMRIDTNRENFGEIEHIIRAIEKGDPVCTSMGCKVPYDTCSICGKDAKTRHEYCVHAKYHMNEIWPDGRRVSVSNPRPRFFDNSMLDGRGADKAAFVMGKVASGTSMVSVPSNYPLSAESAENVYDLRKVAAIFDKESGDKVSDIIKNIPGGAAVDPEEMETAGQVYPRFDQEDAYGKLYSAEEALPEPVIRALSQSAPEEAFSTLQMLGISIRPEEFQRMMLLRAGEEDLANRYQAEGTIFGTDGIATAPKMASVHPLYVDWDLAEKIASHEGVMTSRSAHRPFLLERTIGLLKSAEPYVPQGATQGPPLPSHSPTALMAAIGGLYVVLKQTALANSQAFVDMEGAVRRRPWMLPLMVFGSATLPRIARDVFGSHAYPLVDNTPGVPYAPFRPQAKTAAPKNLMDSVPFRFGVGLPAAYALAGHQDIKQMEGKELGPIDQIMQNHPALLGLGFGMFGGQGARALKNQMNKWVKPSAGTAAGQQVEKLSFLLKEGACEWMPPWMVDEAILNALSEV